MRFQLRWDGHMGGLRDASFRLSNFIPTETKVVPQVIAHNVFPLRTDESFVPKARHPLFHMNSQIEYHPPQQTLLQLQLQLQLRRNPPDLQSQLMTALKK